MKIIKKNPKLILVVLSIVILLVLGFSYFSQFNNKAILDYSMHSGTKSDTLKNMQKWEITGQAMLPGYKEGQQWEGEKFAQNNTQLKRVDVVVYSTPNNPALVTEKRIIGLPGETVKIENGKIFINGDIWAEDYLNEENKTYPGTFIGEGESKVIPANNYFVLGDNRQYSSDSREWGFLPVENVQGILKFCYKNCN